MESDNISQKFTEKLVIVLFLTLFTITIWGTIKIIEAFTPNQQETVDYGALLKSLPINVDQRVLDELLERKESYMLVKPAGEEETDETSETTEEGDQPQGSNENVDDTAQP